MDQELSFNALIRTIYATRLAMQVLEAASHDAPLSDDDIDYFGDQHMLLLEADAELAQIYTARQAATHSQFPTYEALVGGFRFPA